MITYYTFIHFNRQRKSKFDYFHKITHRLQYGFNMASYIKNLKFFKKLIYTN